MHDKSRQLWYQEIVLNKNKRKKWPFVFSNHSNNDDIDHGPFSDKSTPGIIPSEIPLDIISQIPNSARAELYIDLIFLSKFSRHELQGNLTGDEIMNIILHVNIYNLAEFFAWMEYLIGNNTKLGCALQLNRYHRPFR